MEMHDLLSSFFSNIKLKFISGYLHLLPKITREKKKSTNNRLVRIGHIRNGCYMNFWYEKHMNMRLRMNIINHYIILILINGSDRDFTSNKRTKKTHKNNMKKIAYMKYMRK